MTFETFGQSNKENFSNYTSSGVHGGGDLPGKAFQVDGQGWRWHSHQRGASHNLHIHRCHHHHIHCHHHDHIHHCHHNFLITNEHHKQNNFSGVSEDLQELDPRPGGECCKTEIWKEKKNIKKTKL